MRSAFRNSHFIDGLILSSKGTLAYRIDAELNDPGDAKGTFVR